MLVLAAASCGRGVSGTLPSTLTAGADVKVIQRFGMHMHDAIHHWPSVTFGYWRGGGGGGSWPPVENARGGYDFSLLVQYLGLAQQQNVKKNYVLGEPPP